MCQFEQDKIANQMYADSVVFSQWCENLKELNDYLNNEFDKYYEKVFYVCLWELLINSQPYIASLPERLRYSQHENLLEMIAEIKQNITEDEYFMIQYYRNCTCHIFLNKYSYFDKSWNIKEEGRKEVFYDKEGNKKLLTLCDVREIAKNILGEYGLGEMRFKREIRKRLYFIICKYRELI